MKSNLITEEAFNQIQTIQFQRAARTDKGVSAARQVVSLKLRKILKTLKLCTYVWHNFFAAEHAEPSLINDHLPETVRVFALTRVTKGFNSKSQCDARSYLYILPTFSFALDSKNLTLEETVNYRVSTEILDQVNAILALFIGTKNFHNFTSRKKFKDPSANRFIISFNCLEPFVKDGVEFVEISVKGKKK